MTDRRLREVVEECVELPGYEVFKYLDEDGEVRDVKSRDLNDYVKEVMGDEFTPKDFRTWAGTLIAAVKLAELGPVTESEARREERARGGGRGRRAAREHPRHRPLLLHQPAGDRPLPGGFRGSLLMESTSRRS